MTDFERRLTDQLQKRGDAANVSLDLDAVKSHPAPVSVADRSPWRVSWGTTVGVAASAVIVVAGLIALTNSRSDSGDTTFSPAQATPSGSLAVEDRYGALPTAGPDLGDHWHIAYGVTLCGTWTQLDGDLEERDAQGRLTNDDYVATGIHSHDDGVIHLHPFGEAGAGSNATLGVFFANYGIEMDDDTLVFDPQAGNDAMRAAYEQCYDGNVEPVVVVWPDIARPDDKIIVERGLAGVPLGADRMAIAIALTDDPETIELPPSAVNGFPVVDRDSGQLLIQPETTQLTGATVGPLELDGVPPVSAPLVLSAYLDDVQQAVRRQVGDDVFAGAVATNADTGDMTLVIYSTDAVRVTEAVDRIAVDARDRITAVESQYSMNDLERFAAEARRRLDAASIDALIATRWGLDAVEVIVVTPEGEPDPGIQDAARAALDDIPASISFSSPLVPLDGG